MPVPAIISEETFEAAQHRLHRNVQMARRNNTIYAYLLRGLVSCQFLAQIPYPHTAVKQGGKAFLERCSEWMQG